MNSNPDDLDGTDPALEPLFAAVRIKKPDTSREEYGFETRLMAKLAERRARPSLMAFWTWRLAPFFAVVALSFSLWTYFAPREAALSSQNRPFWESAPSVGDDLGGMVLDDVLASS